MFKDKIYVGDLNKKAEKEAKRRAMKKKVMDTIYELEVWCINHPKLVTATVVASVYLYKLLLTGIISGQKAYRDKLEYNREFKTVYDHSLGMRHELKREMKPHEKLLYQQRRAGGEPCVLILADMGLI